MIEQSQELGKLLENVERVVSAESEIGLLNYDTFTKEVWQRICPTRKLREDYPRKLHCSLAPIRAMFGSNWAGKSYWAAAEAAIHATGRYPIWYPEKGKLTQPTHGRILVADFDIIGQVVWPLLKKLIPKADIKETVKHAQHKVVVKCTLKNGSTFHIKTHKEDIEEHRGWKGNWFWADEPCPEDKWQAGAVRGVLAAGGRVWLSLTHLSYPWIYRGIYSKPFYPQSDIFWVQPAIWDNPYNSDEKIKVFADNTNPENRQARLYGRPQFAEGVVFPEFSQSIHKIIPFDISGEGFSRYMTIDPHSVRPCYLSWYATNGEYHFKYREAIVPTAHYKGIVREIKRIESEYTDQDNKSCDIRLRAMDPRFAKQPGKHDKTVILEFSEAGRELNYPVHFVTEGIDTNLDRGHVKIRSVLAYNPEKPVKHSQFNPILSSNNIPDEKIAKTQDEINEPHYYVFNTCSKTIESYMYYSQKYQNDYSEKAKVDQKYKDSIDLDRYYFALRPTHDVQQPRKRTIDQMRGYKSGSNAKTKIFG